MNLNKFFPPQNSYKQTIILALPILAAHVIEALLPFVNTAMAASFGKTALAAAGLVGTTFVAFMGFCWGIISTVGIISANLLGQSRQEKMGCVFWSAFITAILLGLPLMLLFGHMQPLWIWFGQSQAAAEQAQYYFNGLLWAVIADLIKFAIFQFAIACDQPRIPLIANVISLPLLVILNELLAYGLLGFPRMGLFGIGLSTALTYWVICLGMLFYTWKYANFRNYLNQRHAWIEYFRMCFQQLRLGVPVGLMFSIELIFFMVVTLILGQLGETTLAAHQVTMQWMSLTVMFTYGLCEATTILVSKSRGENNYAKIIDYSQAGIILATVAMAIIGLAYWFTPDLLIGIDIRNAPKTTETHALLTLATQFLFACGFYQILDSVRIVTSGILRGLNDAQYPMWISALCYWLIALPIGYCLAFVWHWQGLGLWIGLIVSASINVVLEYRRVHQVLRGH